MNSRPVTKSVQDLPPPGGFPQINVKRGIGPRGPPGWAIWLAVCSATLYGFYQIGRTNEEKRFLLKEKRDARMGISAFLLAEQDQMIAAKVAASLKHEAEVMKNVEGWKVGEKIYSSRWQAPTSGY